jgi:GAF domain-containing protein
MAGKSSSVSKVVKKTGRGKPKTEPAGNTSQGKQARAQVKATRRSVSLADENRQLQEQLAILNSVGEAMAKTLDVKTMTKIVGDKVQSIFASEVVNIRLYDAARNLIERAYDYERGYHDRSETSFPMGKGLTSQIIESGKSLVFGTEQEMDSVGALTAPKLASTPMEETQSYMGVPIITGDKVIGVVSVQSYKQRAYDENDVRLLQTLAANMGVAIQNARIFEAEQERVAELEIINSIQQGLAAELDFQAIVDLVGDKLREVFQTGDFGIRWYDEKTNLVHFLYEYEHGTRLNIPPGPPTPGGSFAQFLGDRQPIIGNTAEIMARTGGISVPGTDTSKSVISVPIISSDRLIGSLQIENYERENAYGHSELRLLTTIAASLGTALENARLFDETQRLLKETEQRNAELAIINSVQAGLASKLDMQAIYDLIGYKVREIFNADVVGIRYYDPSAHLFHYPFTLDHGERFRPDPQPPLGFGAHIIQTRQPIVIHTSEELERRMAELGSRNLGGEILDNSYLFVPILRGDQVTGVLNVGKQAAYAFSASDLNLLTTLANAMSVALENARLFDETQRLLEITEDRAAELAVINSIQQGLAAELNFQSIIDLVGDKLREVLKTDEIGIRWHDEKTNLTHYLYEYEHGQRLTIPPAPPMAGGTWFKLLETRQPVVRNTIAEREALGIAVVPGTDPSKSSVSVPIIGSDRMVGSIIVEDYEKEYAFGESEVRLLTTVAASMGVALENARLFDETQRLLKETEQRNAELAIINSVQAGLVAKMDIQGIYDLVGDKIRDIFDAQAVQIVTHDKQTNLMSYPYVMEKGERFSSEPLPMDGTGVMDYVIRNKQPVLLNTEVAKRTQELTGHQPIIIGGGSTRARLDVPMIVGGEAKGGISLQNVDRENAFTESDMRLLQTLANSMSVALENARLFDETERLLKETEQRAAELAIINSVQRGLASKLEMNAIYELIGETMRGIFSGREILLFTYEAETEFTHFTYVYENGERLYSEPEPISSFTKQIRDTGQPLIINEKLLERAQAVGLEQAPAGVLPKSIAVVPFFINNKFNGIIGLEDTEKENSFGDSDIRLLETLANSMSVALENARLFDETQRLLKETEQRAAELVIINSVQQGLASKLNMQAIYDLIGDKIRDLFGAQVVIISAFDRQANLNHLKYAIERGTRVSVPPLPIRERLLSYLDETHQSLVINQDAIRKAREYDIEIVPDTDVPQSMVFVPLIVGSDVKGLISLQNLDRENAFSEADVRLLQTLANSMSIALENARLFDETQRLLKETEQRAAELSIINSVQQGLASKLDMQAIYDLVGNKVCEIFSLQTCYIMIYDREKQIEYYPFLVEDGVRLVQEPLAHDEQGFGPLVMRTRQPVMINEKMMERSQEVGSYTIGGDVSRDPKSAIYVPLLIGAEAKGVISVQNTRTENAFTDSDLRLLTTLASSMSVALESARLFNETERRATELAIINSAGEAMSRKLDVQTIAQTVGDKVTEIFNADAASVLMLDGSSKMIVSLYERDEGKYIENIKPFPVGKGLTSRVIETRQPLVLHNAQEASELGAYYPPEAAEINPRVTESYLGVPVIVGEKVLGVISAHTYTQNAYDQNSVRLLSTLANNMGVALENARLFDETQRLLNETEQRASELAVINSVQADLSANLEMEAMYQLLGDKLREVFDAQVVTLVDYDPQNNRCYWRYAVEKGEPLVIEPSTPVGFSKHIIETRQMILVNEKLAEKRRELGGAVTAGNPARSYLGVPLLINNQVRGVISLQNVDRENAFSESDVRLLTTLANSMGVALENARLFEETERHVSELATVNTVSSALASELDINALIHLVGEQMRTVFKADIAYVALLDEAAEMINFPYTYGEELTPIRYGEGLTSKIIQSGRSLLLNEDVNQQSQEIGASIVGVVSQSYLGVPIFASGRTVGVVSVQNTSQHGVFTESDERLLSTIAANVGNALQNARLYKEARESRAVAEQANKAKSTFLANMSHELRTPLNAIIGFTRIVRKKSNGVLPEKQLDNLDKVLTSSEHLLGLINTVLDIAKIEAGRMDVIASNFSIGALADQCANLATPLLKAKVPLEKQVDPTLGIIYSDQDKIKQIVINLLSNAAKFTHEGGITLSVQRRDDMTLSISVQDSGIGISEEALGRIFEEFQQADTSTTRKYGGTGLGLAISRNLARLLGGDLTATSELGKGSTFVLTIPIQYGRTPAHPSDTSTVATVVSTSTKVDSARKRILVIDDDPDAAYLLQESLNQNEFSVIGAPNGHSGLQLARDEQPDAILLDILMPETDGWQVLNDLKMDSSTVDIPVILLTIVDKKALGFKLGAAAYLLKPLNPGLVLDALQRVIGEKEHPHKHILVVDDDPHVAEMLRQTLPESDFALDAAEDGEAGLKAIEVQRPDVILLDLMMPKLDGFGVIEKLRSNSELRNIPIIVISAKELTADESKMLKESVAFVMKKQGFDGDLLMQEINSVMKK